MQALPLKPCQFVLADGCTVRDIVRRKQSDRKRNYRVATVLGFKRLLLCKVIEREGKVFPCKVLQFRRTNGSAIRDTVRITEEAPAAPPLIYAAVTREGTRIMQ